LERHPADHVSHLSDADVEALACGDTVATLLQVRTSRRGRRTRTRAACSTPE
jgi:hypothetical protein